MFIRVAFVYTTAVLSNLEIYTNVFFTNMDTTRCFFLISKGKKWIFWLFLFVYVSNFYKYKSTILSLYVVVHFYKCIHAKVREAVSQTV